MFARRLIPKQTLARRAFSQLVTEPATWNSPAAVISHLSNGVKVVTRETSGDAVSMGIYVDGGHRAETAATAGSAYTLQELSRTGTKTRPNLVSDVESLGGVLNVSAGRETNSYSLSLGRGEVKAGFKLLADLATNPNLEAFDGKKSEITSNLGQLELPTRDILLDRLHLCAFRDSSLGVSKIEQEGVVTLSKAALASYVSDTVAANKLVIAADGPVKHSEIVALAEESLGKLKQAPTSAGTEKPYFVGAELIYRNDEMGPTAYMAVGMEGVSWRSPDAVTFMLMAQIIGSYKKDAGLMPGKISGNRVTNNIANKMSVGCADEYECFNIFYKDTGLFGFYAACDEVAVEHCFGEMMLGINMLSFSVTDEEVERAKRELKRSYFSQLDSSAASCADIGTQAMHYGRVMPPAEFTLRLDAIDAEEVKRVAYSHLNDAELSVTALGPLHGLPPYFEMRRSTYFHRY